MKNLYTIKQAAAKVQMTPETLRHYDRIGLVKPYQTDPKTGYRYYSDDELITLQTIELIKPMGLTLQEIREIMTANQLDIIVPLLKEAEKRADAEIKNLINAKKRIKRAYQDYEKKIKATDQQNQKFYRKDFPERVILLSEQLDHPTTQVLTQYLQNFYKQLPADQHDAFVFEDQAGIYSDLQKDQMFAVCRKYPANNDLTYLQAGNYLCVRCSSENKEETIKELIHYTQATYHINPKFILQMIVVTGILQWEYELQVWIE